jgi:oxygen-independent coproporphyrinogen-3 oxidase
MKLELIGHDEKYALEQSLLTLFPGEKPVYGTVDKTADTRWARVTLTEEDERVQVTTELGMDGKSAAHSYDYPLSGTEYEKEGQRRHAVGISFFGAAKDLLGISPAWGSLTGVRPSKVALSLIREGGKAKAERELQELYCVTPARARLAIEAADAGIRAAAELEPNDISLYVGIPFCPTRCAYCSFVAQSVEKSFSLVEPYLEALFDEITAAGQLVRDLGLNVKSFYMGGGTPTTLTADQMDRLLTKLEQNFDFGSLAELTIEAGRPDTIDEEKLRVLRAHNTTRVSINPQTMEDNVLAAIGRRHTADDIRRAMEQVRAAGFPHVNMDLIAGLPRTRPRALQEVSTRSSRWARTTSRCTRCRSKRAAASCSKAAASPARTRSRKCWTMPTPRCVNMVLPPIISTARSTCPAALKMSAGRSPAARGSTTSTSWKSCTPSSRSARAARPRWSAVGRSAAHSTPNTRVNTSTGPKSAART